MQNSKKSNRRRMLGIGALGVRLLAGENTRDQLGAPLDPYSDRSPFEKAVRWRRDPKTPETGSSFTPAISLRRVGPGRPARTGGPNHNFV